MQWMDVAYSELGITEIKGPEARREIVDWFRMVGRPDITSDEVPNCAAKYGADMVRAGIPIDSIPVADRLLARAWRHFGTPLDAPRFGAGCVLKRDSAGPTAGHIGHVTAWTETHVRLLGANQRDQVNESWYPRSDIIALFWPAPATTPRELAANGSRIAAASNRQIADVAKTGTAQLSTPLAPATPPPKPSLEALSQKASSLKGVFETMEAFAGFAATKWPYLAGGLAAYWVGRMAYDAWIIRQARAEDHNTGATAP